MKLSEIFNQLREKRELYDNVKTIVVAVFVALVFRYSVAAPYKIPSGSMIPTLKEGDFIFVSKLSYAIKLPFTNYNLMNLDPPKRGDVIVFLYPQDESLDFIKRVVGVGGDKIELKGDVLYVNDKEMPRKLLEDRSEIDDLRPIALRESMRLYDEDIGGRHHLTMEFSPFGEDFGPVVVPEGKLLMMGDNRDNSKDGRRWGFLDVKKVRGRALFIWFSVDTKGWRIRWERLGQKIQ